MKIRLDFVTNSSSSSYIVATKNNKELEEKMDALLLKWMKEIIFGEEIIRNLNELDNYTEELYWEKDNENYSKIKKCLENNYTIYYREMHFESENDILEAYENLFNMLMKKDVGFEVIDVELGY